MADSIFMQALEGVRDGIQNLNMTGIPDNRVSVRRMPHDGEHYFPGITVHPVEEEYSQGTNMREAIGYGCAVTMVVNNDNDSDYLLDQLLLWREKIRQYFVENDTISSVTGGVSYTLKVEHGKVLDWGALQNKNYDISSLIIRVWVLETRT
jgi:hypothetical protein